MISEPCQLESKAVRGTEVAGEEAGANPLLNLIDSRENRIEYMKLKTNHNNAASKYSRGGIAIPRRVNYIISIKMI